MELGSGKISDGEDGADDGRQGVPVLSEHVRCACVNIDWHLAMQGERDRQPAVEGGRSRHMEALGEGYMHMAMQGKEGRHITTQVEGKRRKALEGAGDGHSAI